MNYLIIIVSFFIFNMCQGYVHAQNESNFEAPVSIREDGQLPDQKAILDIQSNEKGILIPRMDVSERTQIQDPPPGLLVYDTYFSGFYFFDGTSWKNLSEDQDASIFNEIQNLSLDSNTLSISDGNSLAIPISPWTATSDEVYIDDREIGIGFSAPVTPLDVFSLSDGARIRSIGLNSTDKTALEISASNSTITGPTEDVIIGLKVSAGGAPANYTALLAESNGEGDFAGIFDGPVHLSNSISTHNELLLTTSNSTGDSTSIFLSEGNDKTSGMYWLYDGPNNSMELWGSYNSFDFGPHLSIAGINGKIKIGESDNIVLDPEFAGKSRITTDVIEISGGADLAERFQSGSDQLEPGTLVSIDPDNPSIVRPSRIKWDKQAIGVVSEAMGLSPGITLGQNGSIFNGETSISVAGRVYVKGNHTNGVILPGDLVCPSNIPGEVMKVKKHKKARGSIIGKALSKLTNEGYVLIMLSLQ